MKVQAHHDAVLENFGEYKRLWEIWCVIVTKVTTTDDGCTTDVCNGGL